MEQLQLYTINTETGLYEGKSWFSVGNSFVGLTIPYMTADSRTAAAQVSNIDAQADVNGAMVDTIKWVNPTKAGTIPTLQNSRKY